VRLDRYTINELVELLKPFLEDERSRRPFLFVALGNDVPVVQRIIWSGSVATFIPDMVEKLADYGEVESGRQALWALLEYVRSQAGVDVRQRIDKLRPLINSRPKSMDELLALLADHINFMLTIRLCLDTAKKIQNAGKLSEEHQFTINILKNKVSSWIIPNEHLSEMAIQAQAFLRETRQILESEIEELSSQGSNNLLQIEQLKVELEQKIKPLEEQIQVFRQFEQDLKAGQDAAKWLDKNRAALAKRAGNVALDEYQEIKTDFSPDEIDDFYWEIEKYLERISWCLTWGKYDLIEEPEFQTLPVYAYKMSFTYIRDQRIPNSLSSQATTEIKACLTHFIQRLS
jgi:TolA-binding protein